MSHNPELDAKPQSTVDIYHNMNTNTDAHDPEHGAEDTAKSTAITDKLSMLRKKASGRSESAAFLGRVGGNQEFVDVVHSVANAIKAGGEPDAIPGMTLKQQLALRSFLHIPLWKAAVIEGVGTFILVFATAWANISPNTIPSLPDAQFGVFDNAAYVGPLTGGISNFLLLTLFTFAFGITTGAHLNPAITMATFFARMCSLPRAILYMSFQVLGGALGGLMVRAGYGTRDFKVGGCWLFSDVVPVQDAFAIEFMATLTLFFLAFGVGLDPRQRKVIPPSLSPFLVGMSLGSISWVTGYSRYGYGGASMNPARCFGALIGSHMPGWHWIHWVAPLCAAILHAVCYLLVPPGISASSPHV